MSGFRLEGLIVSGYGHAADPLARLSELYRQKTGVSLFPGTLNVELDQDWPTPAGFARIEPGEGGCRVGVTLIRCRIEGLEAFILRTDGNSAPGGLHSLRIVEVAAEVRLRTALGLSDGERVRLDLETR